MAQISTRLNTIQLHYGSTDNRVWFTSSNCIIVSYKYSHRSMIQKEWWGGWAELHAHRSSLRDWLSRLLDER